MENKNINTEMLDEEKLLKAIFADEIKVRDAEKKASEWLFAHEKMVTVDEVIDSMEVAQMALAEDMQDWDEMKDDEKTDIYTVCNLYSIEFVSFLPNNNSGQSLARSTLKRV